MKRVLSLALVLVFCAAFAVPAANAAEKKATKQPPKAGPAQPSSSEVKQGELAQLLVQVLGLSRFLPAAPSYQQCFAALLDNSISPKDGWNADAVVTKADLARVIVQALKRQGDIKNPDDTKEWVDYLKGLGIPLDAVGETVNFLEPLPEPIAPHVVSARTDPLVKRHKFNPIDEVQYGVDMEFICRILSQFEFINGEFRPKPVTQD